jgi:hypothetical protein
MDGVLPGGGYMARKRAKSSWLLASIMLLSAMSGPATAAVPAGQNFEQSLGGLLAGFPGGEPLAATTIAIALGALLLRLTRLLGLLLTVTAAGVLGVVVLMAVEPQMLARLVEAATRS